MDRDAVLFILQQFQATFGPLFHAEQISDSFVVNLAERHLDIVIVRLFIIFESLEKVRHGSNDDSFVSGSTADRVRFAASGCLKSQLCTPFFKSSA